MAQATGTSLEAARQSLLQEAAHGFRGQRHDITTNKGVVMAMNDMFNLWKLDKDGQHLSAKEMNTAAYTLGIALRAIQAVQEEENPTDTLGALLGVGGTVEIKMTKEERKLFLTAGSPEKMAKIISEVQKDGRVVDLEPNADGTFGVKPLDAPPRTDAPMPIAHLSDALRSGGADITRDELRAIVGPSLGTNKVAAAGDVETFGFDALMDTEPKSEPLIAHEWETVSCDHPNLPGTVVRVSKCTRCGITTKNTRKHDNEMCGAV